MKELENRIGYHYKDIRFLENALTHSSYATRNKKQRAAGVSG